MLNGIKNFFKKKQVIKARFIDESGRETTKKIKYTNNTFTLSFFGEDQSYMVDHKKVIYDAKDKLPILYYYVNNPNPLTLEHMRNPEVDAVGFKQIIESKVVKDLFSDEQANLLKIIVIVIIIHALISIVTMARVMGWIKGGGS